MTVVVVGAVFLAVILVACVLVLARRSGSGSGHVASRGGSAASLDAAACSASARAGDRQGSGPF